MERGERLDYLIAEARRADPDRFLCALFAPAERREALLALLLLDAELARVPAAVSQPMAGLIRYQWWRDAVAEAAAGAPRAHPVAEGLAAGLAGRAYPAAALEALVDAREAELEAGGAPSAPAAPAEAHQDGTAGAVQELAAGCLGASEGGDERRAARLVGTAYGLARLARGLPPGERGQPLGRVAPLLAQARRLAPRPPRGLMPAFLPARLARAYARRLAGAGADADRPPLAVLDLAAAHLARRY